MLHSIYSMTDALKQAIEVLRGLSETEQEAAARAIIDLANRDDRSDIED